MTGVAATSRRLAIARTADVAPLAVLLVAVITAIGVRFGPAPWRPGGDSDISDVAHTLVEPTDRIVLVSWITVAVALALRGLVTWRNGHRGVTSRRAVPTILAAAAVLVAGVSIVIDVDRAGQRPPVDLGDVAVGVALAAVVVSSWRLRPAFRTAVTVVVAVAVVGLVAPELWQTVTGVRDWDSFRFVVDEIAAPAAGRVPYGNFAPQYAALLGLPLVPILRSAPADALPLTLGWLIALQAVTLAAAVTIPLASGGRRYVVSAVLVVLAPAAAMNPRGLSATTYFASIPLRTLLPTVTLLVAFVALRRPAVRAAPMVALGILVGATVLNNPDFGLPAAVAVFAAVALARRSRGERATQVGLIAAGSTAVAVGYAVWAAVAGAPISVEFVMVFQRIFGAAGYFNVAMPAFGLHVVVASLFVSASAIGAILLRRAAVGTWLGRQGLVLTLVGGWSLLCLGYYAGRSYTATLVGGHALQIGLVTACLVPLVAAGTRRVRAVGIARAPMLASSIVLAVVAVAWCASNLGRIYPAPVYLGVEYEAAVDGVANFEDQVARLRVMSPATETTQSLEMPALTALASDVGTQTVVNNPGYLGLSRDLAGLQCQQWSEHTTTQVIVMTEVVRGLARSAQCRTHLDLAAAQPIAGTDWVAVPVRRR